MLMFVNGFLMGVGLVIVLSFAITKGIDSAITRETFVKKLIEEKGWAAARLELQVYFGRSYMRTWKKLRKEHFTNGKY